MTRFFSILIALIVVAVLAVYMVTFQVRYDQVAVKTTFEKASDPVILDSTVRSVAEIPANGVLGSDAEFYLTLNTGGQTSTVTSNTRVQATRVIVTASSTMDNAEQDKPFEALRQDVAAALEQAGLADQIDVKLANNRLVLAAKNTDSARLALPRANEASQSSLFPKHVRSVGSVYTDAGLYFKAPWPIEKVKVYPKRVQLLEDELEELRTSDGKSVIVQMYLAWRIDDPYAFFFTNETIAAAEEDLTTLLRGVRGVISQHPFNALVNTKQKQLKLREIENQCADQIRQELARAQTDYGIEVEQVGISRLVLPEATTENVFKSMRGRQERLAENARAEGQATAATIRSDADRAKQTILAFAERRAQAIRAQGDQAAAKYYKAFDQAPDFARFLRQMDALKNMLAKHATFILDTDDLDALEMFRQGPKVTKDGKSNGLNIIPDNKKQKPAKR